MTVLEPNRWLSWQAEDENGDPVWTFTFGLAPVDGSHTRLIVRESFDNSFMPPAAVFALEIPDVVMELKALNTVKERAEGIPQSAFTAPLEIVIWFTALTVGLVALVRFTIRDESKEPLWLMAASAIVLLPITFLFLPLWQRVALDFALLIGFWIFHNRTTSIANLSPRHI